MRPGGPAGLQYGCSTSRLTKRTHHQALHHWLSVSERPWETVNELLAPLSTGTGSHNSAGIRYHLVLLQACKVMGLDLTPDDLAVLETRTEGWIAGLQLAALSMRGRDDVSGFIEAFARWRTSPSCRKRTT